MSFYCILTMFYIFNFDCNPKIRHNNKINNDTSLDGNTDNNNYYFGFSTTTVTGTTMDIHNRGYKL